MGISAGPAAQSRGHGGPPGAVWTAVVLVCATFMALAGAFTAFILYMRPVLKVCVCLCCITVYNVLSSQ